MSAEADQTAGDRPVVAIPVRLSPQVAVGDCYQGIRLLGAFNLSPGIVDGQPLGGLSDLAWDDQAQLLYAVSDDAHLFHLRPRFEGERLADIQAVAAYPLRDSRDHHLRGPWADSEGLAIARDHDPSGTARLAVSYERRPRVIWYTLTGHRLRDEPLPADLRKVDLYADPNKSLESLTLHPRWGLLTAPEWPMKNSEVREAPIVAQNTRRTRWRYPLSSAPNSALVAMEALPDESVLTLERAFVSPFSPLIIALRRTRFDTASGTKLRVDDVAVFDSSRGWMLDNFEGLTRHHGQRFFMVSDDNRSPMQKTLLVYFALLDPTESCARQ
ncbi:MAG: esterase-like activity of phytase family protein [Gammaproteobacteria bacterium]|nr:esterase-like activity of phytase family protein [Gammaproteobacteria bacterium]